MFGSRKDMSRYKGRVVDLSSHARRGRLRRFHHLPRFPRLSWNRDNGRNAAIWTCIWATLLLPACLDFLNGLATDTEGWRIVVDGDTVSLYCPATSTSSAGASSATTRPRSSRPNA